MTQLASHSAPNAETIEAAVRAALGAQVQRIEVALGEVTLYVAPADYVAAMQALRSDRACQFEHVRHIGNATAFVTCRFLANVSNI